MVSSATLGRLACYIFFFITACIVLVFYGMIATEFASLWEYFQEYSAKFQRFQAGEEEVFAGGIVNGRDIQMETLLEFSPYQQVAILFFHFVAFKWIGGPVGNFVILFAALNVILVGIVRNKIPRWVVITSLLMMLPMVGSFAYLKYCDYGDCFVPGAVM